MEEEKYVPLSKAFELIEQERYHLNTSTYLYLLDFIKALPTVDKETLLNGHDQ